MPKRKLTKQYKNTDNDDDTDVAAKNNNENNYKSDNKTKPKNKSKHNNSENSPPSKNKALKSIHDVANVSEIDNSTNIGQLYLNAINDNSNVVLPPTVLYMGLTKYIIKSEYNPILIFNDYFMFILNDVCGYIQENNIDINHIKEDPSKVLTHAFLSILYYNGVVTPSNVTIQKHDSNMILGECLYFNRAYEKNELHIHICTNLTKQFLNIENNYDIIFSRKINHEQCSLRDNLQHFKENIVITQEMYKILINLFVIADHAATHYIEDCMDDKTDWIHHFCFAKQINMYTLICTIFTISASVIDIDMNPKLQVTNKRGPNSEGLSDLERLFSDNIIPIETINTLDF